MSTNTNNWGSTRSPELGSRSDRIKDVKAVQLPLEGGGYVLVSPEDADRLGDFEWKESHHGYAYRLVEGDGRTVKHYMHREIMGNPSLHVDHENGDRLDNRRCNLRVVTQQQNQFNSRKKARASSRYKGVTWQNGRWVARITMDRQTRYLGCFTSELEAAKAYDEAARQMFGPYACTNLN